MQLTTFSPPLYHTLSRSSFHCPKTLRPASSFWTANSCRIVRLIATLYVVAVAVAVHDLLPGASKCRRRFPVSRPAVEAESRRLPPGEFLVRIGRSRISNFVAGGSGDCSVGL
ncbi:unnamed protein product [Linum trigynum]|uniref:Uncharacterized protein n=1 Tax=Linum trigynum TaxID=586398 RepID=A0AAV2D346_9ROSI